MATKRTVRPKKTLDRKAPAASVRDVPVTQAMLFGARDEIIERMDGKFAATDSKFAAMQSDIHQLSANVARLGVLVEEQNSRNAVVMEALHAVIERQGRTEGRLDRVEQTVMSLATSTRR